MDLILENAYDILKLIREFRADVLETYFGGDPNKELQHEFYYTPRYCSKLNRISNVITISEVFGNESIDLNKKQMERRIILLQTDVPNFQCFDSQLLFIETVFKIAIHDIRRKFKMLHHQELERLNEALNCYVHGLNYSTIIMSVSAVEARLFSLMKHKCPNESLDKLTLGQLINKYDDNKERYGLIIPKKHESLLDYCNNYRVFSVHPKEEKITSVNATAILCMTCSFLFDDETKPNKVGTF